MAFSPASAEANRAGRSGNNVDAPFAGQFVTGTFGHASDNSDERPSAVGAAAQRAEGLQSGYDLLFGVVAYGACVEQDGIGAVDVIGDCVAVHAHYGGHHFGVGHVHLASVCLYI